MATYYISPSGLDSRTAAQAQSSSTPWKTLVKACNTVSGTGDIIHVLPGTYLEVDQAVLKVNVSIEGEGIGVSIIKSHYYDTGGFEGAIEVAYPTNTSQHISGITLDGDNLTAYQAIGVYQRNNVSIYNCEIKNFKAIGVKFGSSDDNFLCYNNSFHDNILTNCGWQGPERKNHFGNLWIEYQVGFLCYNNTITQTARAVDENANGISGYGASYGLKLYNNTITVAPYLVDNIWKFAVELWYQFGMEIYGNTIKGEVDLGKDLNKGSYGYGVYIHDNIFGWDTVQSVSTNGIQLEQTIDGAIICNNIFKNLDVGIWCCQYNYIDDFVQDMQIYNNVMYNIGRSNSSSGWGIRFQSGGNYASQSQHEVPPRYYDHIEIFNNSIQAYASSPAAVGIELPTHATAGTVNDISIKNNIIVGFSVAGIIGRSQDTEYPMQIRNLIIQNNILFNNGNSNNPLYIGFTPSPYTISNLIKSNPLFKSSTDLHLDSSSSPAYHAGVGVGIATDKDNVAYAVPNPSIGAYELVGSTPPPVLTDYYISPTGNNNTGTGTASNPYQTLAFVCTKALTPGNLIHVLPGTYNEIARADLAVGVSIIGAGQTSILRYVYSVPGTNTPTDAAIRLHSATGNPVSGNQSISYLRIEGTNLTAHRAIAINFRSDVSIHNCTFVDFDYSGISLNANNNGYDAGLQNVPPPSYNYAKNNKIYDCVFTNCSVYPGTNGHIYCEGQEDFLVYGNVFNQTTRSAGLNGTIITSDWTIGWKLHDNVFTKPDDNAGQWNFFLESWNFNGGCEIYNNTFNGGAIIDVVNCFKGGEAYSLKIYDNDFIMAAQYGGTYIPPSYHTIMAIDIEDRGCYEDLYIYNNYIKNFANGIQLVAVSGVHLDVVVRNIYIYNNLFENIGYTNFDSTSAIGIKCERSSIYNVDYTNINIWNNTIISGASPAESYIGIRWEAGGDTVGVSIRNNIIRGFSSRPIYFSENVAEATLTTISIENNLYYLNGTNAASFSGSLTVSGLTELNNVIGNPNFLSATNFHLTDTSLLALYKGLNVGLTKDMDGVDYNNPPSMGAFEHPYVPPVGYPPVASFTSSVTKLFTSQVVLFLDSSTNTPTTWLWNFGDGFTSSLQNPSHTYTTANLYTVTLTASNAYGSDSEIKVNYIEVNNPPDPITNADCNGLVLEVIII